MYLPEEIHTSAEAFQVVLRQLKEFHYLACRSWSLSLWRWMWWVQDWTWSYPAKQVREMEATMQWTWADQRGRMKKWGSRTRRWRGGTHKKKSGLPRWRSRRRRRRKDKERRQMLRRGGRRMHLRWEMWLRRGGQCKQSARSTRYKIPLLSLPPPPPPSKMNCTLTTNGLGWWNTKRPCKWTKTAHPKTPDPQSQY